MEVISEFKGLNGNIVAFKEAVGDDVLKKIIEEQDYKVLDIK